jgi:hypothetical protein
LTGSRSFREAAARRLAEDRGALPAAVEDLLSDTRRMAIRLLPVRLVELNAARRTRLGETAALQPLVSSIRELGVLEPILVRPLDGGRYELIAGERRLMAARVAGVESILGVVREMDDETALALVAARGGTPRLPDAPGITAAPRPSAAANGSHVPPSGINGSHLPPAASNGSHIPSAEGTGRTPIVISGPGIPGPGNPGPAVDRPHGKPPPPRANARVGPLNGGDSRPRFGLALFPFLRRGRGGSRRER